MKKRYYRQTPSSKGLEDIERRALERYTPEFYANLNTGTLEQYFEERNEKEIDKRELNWLNISIPLIVGSLFVLITSYIGLKIGMAVGGSWYLIYIIGIALRWSDKRIKIAGSISGSVSSVCVGYVFIYTALYILREQGTVKFSPIETLSVAIVGSTLLSVLAVVVAITLRRIWVVEDPLPLPGFEASVTLLDIAQKAYAGTAKQVKRTIGLVISLLSLALGFCFLRDFPINGKSIFQRLFAGRFYDRGSIMLPEGASRYFWANFYLSPMLAAIGWFMRLKGAFIVCLGSIVTWLLINPLAVYFGATAYDPQLGKTILISNPMLAYSNFARIIAIGAIVGSGFAALVKTLPKIRGIATFPKAQAPGILKNIKLLAGIAFGVLVVIFFLTSESLSGSLIISILLILFCFFLAIVVIKIMGETGSTPVSAMGLIVLILLILPLRALGLDPNTTAVLGILAVTAFCASTVVSANLFYDFKLGLYVGNQPKNLIKAQLIGILPGTVLAGVFISILALNLKELDLLAPQANALAAITNALLGFHVNYWLLLVGIAIGVVAEVVTGRGTAFALGMYFPLGITLPLLLGGSVRFLWEKRLPKLKPEEKSLKLVNTYAMCTGLTIGESVMSAIVCLAIMF
ncbi:MAG: OPT/YSL family transporter [Candidatus Thermoplasmatota archaeon]|nr:OPT/YSL family transporter [Candidatus Thermoplasmatota archaeon]MDI6855737.1 OPT/YSL family transporter [Candidatus Thermoplasmatota archaeon]